MSAESLTQKWLRQNVSSYPQKDRVYVDIDAALRRFPTLRPKSDVYTYDDGRTQLLLCVHGLLPISFRGASYNIPIAVWVTREYPRHPPIAYVVPTQDMLVRPSRSVEVSGRCTIEYIQDWERKSEACNLSALLEAMQEQFSRGPPLYAKPKPTASPTPSSSRLAPTPRAPAQPAPAFSTERPALPPKPGSASSPPVPPRPLTTSSNHIPVPAAITPQTTYNTLYNRPPPPLPRDREEDVRPPQYQHPLNSQFTPSGTFGGPSSGLGRESLSPAGNYHMPFPPHSRHTPSLGADSPPPMSHSPPSGPYPHSGQVRQQSMSSPPPTALPPPIMAPKPATPPQNLLDEESGETSSFVPDHRAPAPPRPPNPELLRLHTQVHQKIVSELASLSQVMYLDAERLQAQQTDLLAGEPAIRDEMARLEAVRDVCRNVSGRLRSTVEQGERNVSDLRRKGDPEVDELVCSTSIVHNQLVNLVAEDNAIEDTVYHLHRALNTGRIDLERFLRTTRVLAEEQFMKRALIEKIQAGIPMGMSVSYS
ncbi:UEV-domain-containing protein [Leucogyrophana mollusca]|uniref:UEV-domain-containing protein n=1 Tax=Leucogyrophana mollusca TaxID=85980 RepID=A0ACB8C1A5_9AGAM|nr:UEV-domain-containing protein [Leucogyrophana mollusca]